MKISIAILALLGTVEAKRASTTRYWDCSGGACGCGFGSSALNVHCHSNAMFKAPEGNPYGAVFYGSAAVSQQLGGDWWLGRGCGQCFKVTGTANVAGHTHTSTVVLKGTNFCPPSNSVCNGQAHFDIAAPGFDYAPASQSNICDRAENEKALKSPQTCMYWMIRSQNPDENCNCDDFNDETLKNGCKNFKSLYWNNPEVDYEEIDCPAELKTTPPCWHDNGDDWPQ